MLGRRSIVSRGISPAGATNVRWRILMIVLLLGVINFIDRASLAVAMPYIAVEFDITDPCLMGLLHSMFFWSYALMQLPCGVLADRFNTRYIIACATVAWGIFQGLGALCRGYMALALTRVGLGITEAPIMPASTKLMGNWLTPNERGRGAVLLDGGAPLGVAFGAVLLTFLIALFGSWRQAFVIAGVVTVLAGVLAYFYIRSVPAEHPHINPLELDYILRHNKTSAYQPPSLSWAVLKYYVQQRNVLALIGGWVCYNIVFYGLMLWLPVYLQHTHHVQNETLGGAIGAMFLLCFIGQQLGGWVADYWRKIGGSNNKVFHTLFAVSAITAGVAIFFAAQADQPITAILLFSVALFPLRWASIYWSIPSLLGAQRVAGTICGMMNFTSSLTGAIAPIVVGVIIHATHSYDGAMLVFVAAAIGYLFCSLRLDFNQPIKVATTDVFRKV